jgi:hypothetical protein
MEYICFLFIG